MYSTFPILVVLVAFLRASHASFYDDPPPQIPEGGTPKEELLKKWDAEFGYVGVSTFAHLQHVKCLTTPEEKFDIGIIGAPFDTAVSFRPGARFGPRALRAASARQLAFRAFNPRAGFNPYQNWAKILDCGDIPISPFDNALALRQMSEAYLELGSREAYAPPPTATKASTAGKLNHPKLITLGGDHSIALATLRALQRLYNTPITVLHFDAHQDTWHPGKYPSYWSPTPSQSDFTHGSMFWLASQEGLIENNTSVHGGLRSRLTSEEDITEDAKQGFMRIECDDIDDIGVEGVVSLIMRRIGTERPVYLSVDIDVIDPGLAPGTGTPEPGGWTTRELVRILRGISRLNVVAADVVEVSPSYDGQGEETALAGAQIVYELLTSIVNRGALDREHEEEGEGMKRKRTLQDFDGWFGTRHAAQETPSIRDEL
ncbi:MAG: hypothetical protein Q9227_008711 [Pyrenula ochraceoflavens]